ncbi:MAG: nucleotidyltransferase domain-containing protein [Pedobacter sp.]|nr:MAG: nucleotidyltransferase domain-containing protein [Pedobacter sp.]
MIQKLFAFKAVEVFKTNSNVLGLAAAGSWITDELDEFSDLDLVVVTKEKIGGNLEQMRLYAKSLGILLSGFTGEHVGEPRVLICLFDDPLLHVDLKFVTLEEFHSRVETPAILFDTEGQLDKALKNSEAIFPHPDFQWIEDRFWVWIHYALLKIGRGENLEAFDFLSFLRMTSLGPLLHIKNGNLPKGVRKVEAMLMDTELKKLTLTIPNYERSSLLSSLNNAVSLYRELREELFDEKIKLNRDAEVRAMDYFKEISDK